MNDYTNIDGFVICDDCGCSSETIEGIEHYATCMPGESKHWEKHYAKVNL